MTDNIIRPIFGGPDGVGAAFPVPVNKVLAGARMQGLNVCVVVGMNDEGELYVASTCGRREAVFWLEAAKLYNVTE